MRNIKKYFYFNQIIKYFCLIPHYELIFQFLFSSRVNYIPLKSQTSLQIYYECDAAQVQTHSSPEEINKLSVPQIHSLIRTPAD